MDLKILICLIAMILLAGCGERHDPVFDRLEERVSDCPDSVRTVLEGINPEQIPTEFDRSRHAMLLMMARHKCRQELQPDSNLYKAAEYFHRKKDLLNEAKARYYAGVAQREAGDYQAAIREALQAIDRSHEAADTFWMGRAHSLAFEIYLSTYDCKNAAIEADKAAVYFKRAGATPFHRYALLDKAQALNYPVHEDGSPIGRGMFLLDSLKKVAIDDGDSSLVTSTLYHQSIHSYESGNFDLAERRMDSIRLFSRTSPLVNYLLPNIISIQIAKGGIPNQMLEEYQTQLTTPEDTLSYLNLKSKTAVAKGDWKSAYQLVDSMCSYYDVIMADKTFRSVDEIKDHHNKKIIEEQQKENTHIQSTRYVIIYVAVGILMTLLALFLIILVRNKYRERQTMGQLLDIALENDGLKRQIERQSHLAAENSLLKTKMEEQSLIIEQYHYLKTKMGDFDRLAAENSSLIRKLETQETEYKRTLTEMESALSTQSQRLAPKKILFLGNRIDALCDMAMDYYDDDDTKTSKNVIYNRIVTELRHLKSENYLKGLECKINEIYDNIIERFKNQLPDIAEGNTRWIALMIGGLSPQTISFLLDMKIQTLYSKRLRLRSYIEKSEAPDKNEFLLYFPKAKK